MKTVTIAALKHSLSATLRRVEAGEEVTVTDRDRPIAVLRAVEDDDGFTLLPAEVPFARVRSKRYPPTRKPIDSLAALLAERGSR